MSPIPILLASVLALAGQQNTPPATQPTDPATRPATRPEPAGEPTTAQEGRMVAEMWIQSILANRPQVEPGQLTELMTARLENGFLLIELREEPPSVPVAMPLSDRAGSVAELAPIRRPRLLPEEDSPATARFRLFVHHLGEPGDETYSTDVELYSGSLIGQLNMTMVQTRVGGSLTVQLIQLVPGQEQEPAVRLHIQRQDEKDEAGNMYERVEARSFQDLALSEPELFKVYVRPMLKELGLEDVVGGDVQRVATQVFLAELPVEAGVRERVEQLLAQLDAADFEAREQAQRALEELGRPAATALLKVAQERELSLEQTARTKTILAEYQPLDPEQLRQRGEDEGFLREVAALSGGPEEEALAKLAAQKLEELGAPAGPSTRPAE